MKTLIITLLLYSGVALAAEPQKGYLELLGERQKVMDEFALNAKVFGELKAVQEHNAKQTRLRERYNEINEQLANILKTEKDKEKK